MSSGLVWVYKNDYCEYDRMWSEVSRYVANLADNLRS